MEPAALAAQQAAIQDVRARFERGELTADAFERALDALLLARDAEECRIILRALPASPLASLAALEPPRAPAAPLPAPAAPLPAPAPAAFAPTPRKRIVAVMSQTKKVRRPWRLDPNAHAVAVMGEVKLDLRLAELPPHALLRVTAVMGTVMLYVPLGVRVSVRSTAVMSDVGALDEHASGVVAFGHEEHAPDDDPGTPRLEIEVFALMSNVQVVLAGPRTATISELVRGTVEAAVSGFRRGLQQGTSPRPPLPDAAPDPADPRLRRTSSLR
jgi:hypothetical protein